ncbi:MAG: MMPL family transporter [Fibrobacter sp.]|nr:MMPL family transporter [Fibrobacter sp.]
MIKEAFVVKFRWPIIITSLLLAGLLGFQLLKLDFNTDPLFMFSDKIQSKVNTEKIEKIFGTNDLLFILLETDDVLNEQTLNRVKTLSQNIKKVDGIKSVLSLFDTKEMKGEYGAMIVDPAIKAIPHSDSDRLSLRNSLSKNELAMEVVVSKDFKATALLLTLAMGVSRQDVYQKVKSVVNATSGTEKLLIGGLPAFQTEIMDSLIKDLFILIPIALIIILMILFGFFRQIRGIVLPLSVVLLSTLFGMGILPLMGWKITILTAILPIMVIAFSNNYAIYLIARYKELVITKQDMSRKEIASDVFKSLYQPILFSGLTTMVGLLGMLSHAIAPAQQIGIAAALAIGFSLIVSLGGIPAVLSLIKLPKKNTVKESKTSLPFLDKLLHLIATPVVNRPKMTLLTALLVIISGIIATTFIKVDANQENLFGKNHPINKCTKIINKYFGGSQNISVLFKGDVKDPKFLTKLEQYKDTLQQMKGVGQVSSMADVIRMMSKALNDSGDPGYNRIPESRDAVAQYLELYSMSGSPDDFEQLVDFNFEKTHFIVRLNDGSTPVVNNIVKKIQNMAAHDTELVSYGGYATMFADLAASILKGQISSIIFALASIVLLVILMFRSFSAGLLASVPLIFAIITGFGIMGAFGINLDMATAMITSIVIGTGVDFTLQFLWRYKSIRLKGLSYSESVKETILGIGSTIVFNATCITFGLGVMIFSSVPPLRYFALLFGVLTLACMLGTLIIVPALCLVWKPRFLEPVKK